jgi:hypothetical protein
MITTKHTAGIQQGSVLRVANCVNCEIDPVDAVSVLIVSLKLAGFVKMGCDAPWRVIET